VSARGARVAICFAATGLALVIAAVTALLMPVAAAFAAPAAAAASSGPDPVRYFPASDVQAAFDHGAVLLDAGSFMVHASRRDAAGMAEVHLKDTDILHVLHGGATIVTGGTVIGGKPTAPDEERGSSIEGGATRRLAEGDVLVVPHGVPHWFRDVDAPFLYYVVKVR
jgi:glc operon protein GlcG